MKFDALLAGRRTDMLRLEGLERRLTLAALMAVLIYDLLRLRLGV